MNDFCERLRDGEIKPVEFMIKSEHSKQWLIINPIFFEIGLPALVRKIYGRRKDNPTVQCLTLADGRKVLIFFWERIVSRFEEDFYSDVFIVKEILYHIVEGGVDAFLVPEVKIQECGGDEDQEKVKYVFCPDGEGVYMKSGIEIDQDPDILSEIIKPLLEEYLEAKNGG